MNLEPEAQFFHDINVAVRNLVQSFGGKAEIAQHKYIVGDYATEIDIAVEEVIIAEIQKRFPGDAILAEETHSDVTITDGRIWIIDPICGTANLGRGLTSFCTNIAIADDKELIAACVIDHSQNGYYWSVGNRKVYVNERLCVPKNHEENFGVVIDIDFGALTNVGDSQRRKHIDAAYKLTSEPGYMLQSLSSSLGFAYTAIGKIDGFINAYNHPWDICAASYLIQQAGGIITGLNGEPWTLSTIGAISANSELVYRKLLDAYKQS